VLLALGRYDYPGNVRELRNVVERAVILSSREFLEVKHLPPYVTETPAATVSNEAVDREKAAREARAREGAFFNSTLGISSPY